MSTEDDNRDDELSALYHKADDATPPASLDESILATAKQAAEDKTPEHKSARSPFSGHWPVAISAAAVFVIAILLTPTIEQQAPLPDTTTMQSRTDELHKSAGEAEAKKTMRERSMASSPARLYAPAPSQTPALQQESATETGSMDEDSFIPIGRSLPAETASGFNSESEKRRAQARLNAAGGSPLAIFTPEMWLVKIQQLLDSGKIAEAADELDRFRHAHPDVKLDETLLERLKQP